MDASEQAAENVGYLIDQIYAIHEVVIQETGGMEGLRDGFMLHAAAARPFATFAGEALYQNDFEQAAALFHSLIKSHPFLDGTKGTAFLAALYFLANCGHSIPDQLPRGEAIRFCLSVAEENLRRAAGEPVQLLTIGAIAAWFRWLISSQA